MFVGSMGADPCMRLCDQDGPAVCTGGSWSKNGVCHGYLFRGNPSLKDYCYHTTESAADCPSNGTPLKERDAWNILFRAPEVFDSVDMDYMHIIFAKRPVNVVLKLTEPSMDKLSALLDSPSIELLGQVLRMEDIEALELVEGIQVSGGMPFLFNCNHSDVDARFPWFAQFQVEAPLTDEEKEKICSALFRIRAELVR
jgi:hypothetical protein